jgi:2-polyprenyl-3-methyl-5-hydroxy-6-metoxy-1,4-benzoquinol methylase
VQYKYPMVDPYVPAADGVLTPPATAPHRDSDYDSSGFASLRRMQARHFWYRGRHRFILHFARRIAAAYRGRHRRPDAIDLGGGCGGWVEFLSTHAGDAFGEIALADSSPAALAMARDVVPAGTNRYRIDLLNLQWSERWDVAFLLDVLEHIERDEEVLRQIRAALRPGGSLVVATPALEWFRSTLDDVTHHVRRYARADFERLAERTGLELVTSRYFMFLLSPLLWAARRRGPDPAAMSVEDIRQFVERSARIPAAPVNSLLAAVFAAETPLGAWLPFPWGTSVLAVLRRPHARAT